MVAWAKKGAAYWAEKLRLAGAVTWATFPRVCTICFGASFDFCSKR